jgi:cobalt-zinc-cadmium efflux system protein
VLLEATPKDVDIDQVRQHILEAPGVPEVHDLHAWTITSGMNVISAHVVIDRHAKAPAVLDHLCNCLSSQFDIEHSLFSSRAKIVSLSRCSTTRWVPRRCSSPGW